MKTRPDRKGVTSAGSNPAPLRPKDNPRKRPITLAQLRKAAPKGWSVHEKQFRDMRLWFVEGYGGGDRYFSPQTGTWHPNQQTARRACLVALKEMGKEGKHG